MLPRPKTPGKKKWRTRTIRHFVFVPRICARLPAKSRRCGHGVSDAKDFDRKSRHPAVVPRTQECELISWHLNSDRVRHEAITELYLRGLSPGHVLRAKGGMCSTDHCFPIGPMSRVFPQEVGACRTCLDRQSRAEEPPVRRIVK